MKETIEYDKTIFGMPIKEIRRQLDASKGYDYSSDYGPIDRNTNHSDVCIAGGEKIISNPELLSYFRKLYRRIDKENTTKNNEEPVLIKTKNKK